MESWAEPGGETACWLGIVCPTCGSVPDGTARREPGARDRCEECGMSSRTVDG